MQKKSIFTTRNIVLTGLLAALTVAGSAIRVPVPLDIVGTTAFHLGNIMCALSGILLGPWLGGIAAGLGSAIYDMLNPLYISEAWITFLFKGLYGLVVGLVMLVGKKHWSYGRAAIATTAGAVTYAVIYLLKSYFYNGLLLHSLTPAAAWITVLGKLPATIFNAAVAIIFAPILAIPIYTALKKAHMTLE